MDESGPDRPEGAFDDRRVILTALIETAGESGSVWLHTANQESHQCVLTAPKQFDAPVRLTIPSTRPTIRPLKPGTLARIHAEYDGGLMVFYTEVLRSGRRAIDCAFPGYFTRDQKREYPRVRVPLTLTVELAFATERPPVELVAGLVDLSLGGCAAKVRIDPKILPAGIRIGPAKLTGHDGRLIDCSFLVVRHLSVERHLKPPLILFGAEFVDMPKEGQDAVDDYLALLRKHREI